MAQGVSGTFFRESAPYIRQAVEDAPEVVRNSDLVLLLANTLNEQKEERKNAEQQLKEEREQAERLLTDKNKLLEAVTQVDLSIFFDAKIHTFETDGYQRELTKIVNYLKANPHVHVFIQGYTDAKGDPEQNLALAERRIQSVRGYLTASGVEQERLTGETIDPARPILKKLGNPAFNQALERKVVICVNPEATQEALEDV